MTTVDIARPPCPCSKAGKKMKNEIPYTVWWVSLISSTLLNRSGSKNVLQYQQKKGQEALKKNHAGNLQLFRHLVKNCAILLSLLCRLLSACYKGSQSLQHCNALCLKQGSKTCKVLSRAVYFFVLFSWVMHSFQYTITQYVKTQEAVVLLENWEQLLLFIAHLP